uniref:Uncharacterized protein n=1 Tax=Rousettus aegyptiacus TaxID=9407 RepID=A0A7J8CIB8_ROUAE|nr:hypothetical protein HJG63_009118 [Rousettus aegyptiacus]
MVMQGEPAPDPFLEMVEEGRGAGEAGELWQRGIQAGVRLRHLVVQVQLPPRHVAVHPGHQCGQGDAEPGPGAAGIDGRMKAWQPPSYTRVSRVAYRPTWGGSPGSWERGRVLGAGRGGVGGHRYARQAEDGHRGHHQLSVLQTEQTGPGHHGRDLDRCRGRRLLKNTD